jgi:hypothetical protein
MSRKRTQAGRFLRVAQVLNITMDDKTIIHVCMVLFASTWYYAGVGVRNGLKFVNTSCWKRPLAALKEPDASDGRGTQQYRRVAYQQHSQQAWSLVALCSQ